ncbi:MAG: hemerythrin domain-containing protein [Halobacteriovoraceae bacterium]|nr:hemerythrin domain-containing protein [Halobacteriovoraceae bacterium]
MQVTDILMLEHQRILSQLNDAEELLEKPLKENLGKLDNFLVFITDYADSYHHAKEEEIFFNWMRSKNPSLDHGPLRCMLSEHDSGRELITGIKQSLKSYINGDLVQEDFIHSRLSIFISLLRDHIEKEDRILYKMAEQLNDQFQDGDEIMLPKFVQVRKKHLSFVDKYEHN